MIDVLAILANAGKVIGAAKTVKTVSTAVTEDREAKRKAKELNKNIATIENRSIFEALMMYVMAAAAGGFLSSTGLIGFILTILVFLSHCNSLKEIGEYTSIKREKILSAIIALIFAYCFFFM